MKKNIVTFLIVLLVVGFGFTANVFAGVVLSDDFEDGSINTGVWDFGGEKRGYNSAPAGSWEWTHEEIINASDGYLRAHVWGPYTGNTYGAEAWIKTKRNFNDGQDYLINVTWQPDFADSHYNMYFLQVTDGYIPISSPFHWQLYEEPGTTDLLWTQSDATGDWSRGWTYSNKPTPGKLDWSLEILPSGVAYLYDAPDKGGALIRQESLDLTKDWYFRLMVNDGTSSGFGAGDAWFDIYDFEVIPEPATLLVLFIGAILFSVKRKRYC